MKKAYIVMRKGYEYDDNIYSETEGGVPEVVCFSIEDAQLRVKELNIKSFKEVSITEYGYDHEDLVNCEWNEFTNFNKQLVEKYGEVPKAYKWESNENRLHPKANTEEVEKYYSMVDISFYDLVETELDIQSFRSEQINSIL